jgi:hypothetical protein
MGKPRIATPNMKEVVADTRLKATRSENDTIRLWENYKDQALMWRSLSLIQFPATFAALIFATVMWSTRVVNLTVPSKPEPGIHVAQDIPDTEFINAANTYVNLVATYQPGTARNQFGVARSMLKEPVYTKFTEEMMGAELGAIESTGRTQVFFTDPLRTKVTRNGNEVTVNLVGERWKVIAGSPLPTVTSRFTITMSTIPRNPLNPYGIVITGVSFKANIEGEQPATDGAQS